MTNKISNHNFVKHVNFYAPSSSYIHAMNPLVLHHALHHLVLSPLLFLLVVTSSLSHGEFSFKTKFGILFSWFQDQVVSPALSLQECTESSRGLKPAVTQSLLCSITSHQLPSLFSTHVMTQFTVCKMLRVTEHNRWSLLLSAECLTLASHCTWSISETLPPFISMHCIFTLKIV